MIATLAVARAQPMPDPAPAQTDPVETDPAAAGSAAGPVSTDLAPSEPPAVTLADPTTDPNETIDPSQLPVEPPPPPAPYPRALVERPLLLPAGRSEFSAAAGIGYETMGDVAVTYSHLGLGARVAFGTAEPYAVINLAPVTSIDPPVDPGQTDFAIITRIIAGIKVQLLEETAIGVQGVLGNVDSDYKRYSPSVFVQYRHHMSSRGAIQLGAGADYNHQHATNFYGSEAIFKRVGAFANAKAELQATPILALELHGGASIVRYVDDLHTGDNTARGYYVGAAIVIAATESFDLGPYFTYSAADTMDASAGGFAIAIH